MEQNRTLIIFEYNPNYLRHSINPPRSVARSYAARRIIKSYQSFSPSILHYFFYYQTVSHEKNGIPDTNVGDYIMKLADLKMRVEGFKVTVNSRAGDKMKDFLIWEKGANEYIGQ